MDDQRQVGGLALVHNDATQRRHLGQHAIAEGPVL